MIQRTVNSFSFPPALIPHHFDFPVFIYRSQSIMFFTFFFFSTTFLSFILLLSILMAVLMLLPLNVDSFLFLLSILVAFSSHLSLLTLSLCRYKLLTKKNRHEKNLRIFYLLLTENSTIFKRINKRQHLIQTEKKNTEKKWSKKYPAIGQE